MPLPRFIKPKRVVWVVWTILGPHYVSEEKDSARAYMKMMEESGHKALVRKYHIGRGETHDAD